MPFYFFVWDDVTIEHLAEHGVSPDDFEKIVQAPENLDVSRTTGRAIAFGMSDDGRYLACVYEFIDEDTIQPITAYDVEQ